MGEGEAVAATDDDHAIADGEGARLRRCLSALVTAGIAAGYLANPRLKEVHWQAGGRAAPEPQVSVSGETKPIYTAPGAAAAREALDQHAETWGQRYGAIIRLWENAWSEFIPFLDYDVEIRKVICSTNAIVISSLN